jgi:hypothetical protein
MRYRLTIWNEEKIPEQDEPVRSVWEIVESDSIEKITFIAKSGKESGFKISIDDLFTPTASERYQQISRSYWPNPRKNESADRELGNWVVDSMTLGELVNFFGIADAGPTYCLVKERVLESLEKLPPKLQVKTLEEEAKSAFVKLQTKLRTLEIWMDAEIEFRKK